MFRGAAAPDAIDQHADADHRRHVRERVHHDAAGTERADQGVQPDDEPRAAKPDRDAAVRGRRLDHERVRSDPARLDKVASTIRSNAERLSWLVDNLQRLARLGDPLDVPSQQHIELEGLASEVARQLEEMATARGVTIRIGRDLPTLFGDPAHLELILLNLVSNAIKYSDPDKPEGFV
jgi:signal transduction histidine kinase